MSLLDKKFILLSNLINKLNENNYYRVFAKTIAMTEISERLLPPDDDLIKEMFNYFIKKNILNIYHKDSMGVYCLFEDEDKINALEEKKKSLMREMYVNVPDLKKLYANKCIVLPNSLLADI
tara:strand:+ start:333 stop:698 length:366 start_codon:yes stop_codon:yes gene_type:complete